LRALARSAFRSFTSGVIAVRASRLVSAAAFRVLVVVLSLGIVSIPQAHGQVTFVTGSQVANPDALEFQGTAVGDFNGDGRPDLATLSDNRGKNLYILLNLGAGQFSVAHTYTLSVNGGSPTGPILVGDLNNDGKLDLVVITIDPITQYWTLNVLLGNGDGSFTGPTAYPQEVQNPFSPVLADFNGDHNLDLALVQNYASMVIFYGNGDGTFQAPVSYFVGEEPVALAAADFNNDGKTDAAVLSEAGLGVLLGNGDGTFQNPTFYATGITSHANNGALFAGDLDGGNIIDLIGETDSGEQVFLGKGDGTFTALAPVNNLGIQILADINLDGRLDAAAGGAIQLGNGDGTFGNPIVIMTWNKFCCTGGISAVADFNGDGLPDLAVNSNSYGVGEVIFLLNSTPPGFEISASALTPAPVTAGGSASSTVTLAPVAGFNGMVSLSCAGLPSGAGCLFNPPSVPGGSGKSQLTVTTSSATAGGTYPVKVTGTSNSLVQSSVVSLVVQAAPDFAIGPASGSQDSQTISAGQTATFDLAVAPAGSFSGAVDLTCSISPVATAGPTCSLPSSVQVTAGKAAPVTVMVATTAPVTTGTISEVSDVLPGALRFAWTLLLFGAGFLVMAKRRRLPVLEAPMIVLTLGFFAGCGGGGGSSSHTTPGTPSGRYTATITATSGNLKHSTALTVVVQ
jgi:hypothetical protein